MKEIVKLRGKVSKQTGTTSLFLEWNENGKRRFEFLGLYLSPKTDAATKRMNKVTMEAAQTIQAKRIIAMQERMAGIKRKSNVTLGEQVARYIESHKQLSANYVKALNYAWQKWEGIVGDMLLTEITKECMMRFSEGLMRQTSPSTASHIYIIIGTILQSAVRDGIIPTNPTKTLDISEKPRGRSAEKEYLTLDELRILADTPCKNETLKRAFLFSCFTGLRISDIVSLRWKEVGENMVQKRMVKTREMIYQPISANASKYLPPRGKDEELVFVLKEYTQNRRDLKSWMESAGIGKHITFHCARHTFACLLLEYNADIYTVSKLLGHKDIHTTQIYAKMVDKKKEEAVSLIPSID